MNPSEVFESLISYFMSEHQELSWVIFDIVDDKNHPLNHKFYQYINGIDNRIVDDFLEEPVNKHIYNSTIDARIAITCNNIENEVISRKLDLLCKAHNIARPEPYNHPDLLDVVFDKHQLVKLEDLNIERGGAIRRKEHIFQILPSLPQKNSMYWVLPYLSKLGSGAEVKIRLDPFMIHPADSYNEVAYKMRVYGTPLDWNDISNLKEIRHARWIPDSLGANGIHFTDVAWVPRSDGVHFVCEEVPTITASKYRGSRYLHGIYNPTTANFVHVDGAVRLYTEDEISNRYLSHVRNSGKSGIRIKIFQVDGEIHREMWCGLAVSFFVWNNDVQEYFMSASF